MMKKNILMFILVIAVATFAEVKIEVNQSIIYADGAITMSSLPIDLKKALKTGGKVSIKYDFSITRKGFFDSDDSYIFLKFPSEYPRVFTNEKFLKVTSFFGAKDVSMNLLESFKNRPEYSSIRESVGRLPKLKWWFIQKEMCDKESKLCKYENVEDFVGVVLRMRNEKENKASIEFYFDFEEILETYDNYKEKNKKFADWIYNNMLREIPIDINFHTLWSYIAYDIPNAEHVAKYGYDRFWIVLGTHAGAYDEGSNSNHSYTIMVK